MNSLPHAVPSVRSLLEAWLSLTRWTAAALRAKVSAATERGAELVKDTILDWRWDRPAR